MVEAADDICYTIIDFEDGIHLGWIEEEYALEYLINLVKEDMDTLKYSKLKHRTQRLAYLRSLAINSLIKDAVRVFTENETNILNGSFGNDLYNLTKYKTNFFNQAAYNKDSALLNAWTPENSNSSIPRLSLDDPNNNIRPSSYYVENGSYFKLNNAQLGYTFSAEKLSGIELRVYAQATNLFTLTDYSGMNPQIGLQNYSLFAPPFHLSQNLVI